MNNLTGKEWLQNSFTIWRDVVKTQEERATKHPALFPQELVEKLIQQFAKKGFSHGNRGNEELRKVKSNYKIKFARY